MKRKNIFGLTSSILYLLGTSSIAFAGSLTPANYENRVGLNETISVEKTVTVGATDIDDVVNESTTTVNNKYDILFLADNTGSMGTAIENVQTNAQSLLQQLSTTYNDIQFGVARYYGDPEEAEITYNGKKYVSVSKKSNSSKTLTAKWKYKKKKNGKYHYEYTLKGLGYNKKEVKKYNKDYGKKIERQYYYEVNSPNHAYELQESVNGGSVDDAISAIDNWSAFGGGDLPEANMFALHQAATSGGSTKGGLSTGFNTNWRSDTKKIIVWFGDASSHELSVDQAETIQALNDNGITVVAINASNSTTSLTSGINLNSQASSIATATNGKYAAVYSSNLTDSMLTLIGDAVSNITTQTITPGTIDLQFESQGDISGITVTYTCTDSRGCNDVGGSESRTFRMDVTGNNIGEYNFNTVVTGVTGATGSNTIDVYGFPD